MLLDVRGNALKAMGSTELKLDVESQFTVSGVKKFTVDFSLSLVGKKVSLIL